VNSFEFVSPLKFTEGDLPELYFQLFDLSKDRGDRFNSPGRRYVPAVGSILQIHLLSIDDSKEIFRFATQPFLTDSSIWMIQLQQNDIIRGSVGIRLELTEGSKVTHGYVANAISVDPMTNMDSTMDWRGGYNPRSLPRQ